MKFVLTILTTFQLFIGVAIAQEQPEPAECDPRYTGACVPVYKTKADDVDCGDIEERNFTVVDVEEDPHRLDGDNDGIACESRR